MDAKEFINIRKKLKKTQKEMAQLLGTSLKTVHSYEQGWRKIPYYVERHLYYLLFILENLNKQRIPCWEYRNCDEETRLRCPAWQLKNGAMCWFINGTYCSGVPKRNWEQKMSLCKECRVFTSCMGTQDIT